MDASKGFSTFNFLVELVLEPSPISIPRLPLRITVRLCLGLTYQKITPLLFKVPLYEVEDQACVYGDLTASGIAGGLAGEYAGKLCLE